jgi:hypothetical protein
MSGESGRMLDESGSVFEEPVMDYFWGISLDTLMELVWSNLRKTWENAVSLSPHRAHLMRHNSENPLFKLGVACELNYVITSKFIRVLIIFNIIRN